MKKHALILSLGAALGVMVACGGEDPQAYDEMSDITSSQYSAGKNTNDARNSDTIATGGSQAGQLCECDPNIAGACGRHAICLAGGCIATGQVWGHCQSTGGGGGGDPQLDDPSYTSDPGHTLDDQAGSGSKKIATEEGQTLSVACGCNPSNDSGCGANQYCKIGGCTNPTETSWGRCVTSGSGGSHHPDLPESAGPGNDD